jgi:hypothetical protein
MLGSAGNSYDCCVCSFGVPIMPIAAWPVILYARLLAWYPTYIVRSISCMELVQWHAGLLSLVLCFANCGFVALGIFGPLPLVTVHEVD